MEEEKAISYYDELTRKGEGAARFKQGLGFSGNNTCAPPSMGSALASRSSFLSNFVKSSSPSQTPELERQAQLESIQNKLKKKPRDEPSSEVSDRNSRELKDRDRDRDRERNHKRRSRSRDKYRDRRGNISRSRSRSPSSRRDRRSERRKRSRSLSPRRRRTDDSKSRDVDRKRGGKERKGDEDFSKLIPGYEKMLKMTQTKAWVLVGNDLNSIRTPHLMMRKLKVVLYAAVEDDAAVVKHIGQSFRFSAVEAKNEEKIKAAHDEAMFGAPVPAFPGSTNSDSEPEADNNKKESDETQAASSLLSEKVLAKQQSSWRDRARKA